MDSKLPKNLGNAVLLFEKMRESYLKKTKLLSEYSSLPEKNKWNEKLYNQFRALFLSQVKDMVNQGKNDSRTISALLKGMRAELTLELGESPLKKMRLALLRDIVSMHHRIGPCLDVNRKQLELLEKTGKNPVLFADKSGELDTLLSSEGRLLNLVQEDVADIKELSTPGTRWTWDYTVVGYGSLMDVNQIAERLEPLSPELKARFKSDPRGIARERLLPVLVFGWMRVFNRRATSHRWVTRENEAVKALAAMDIVPSHRHYFNAVAIRVSREELQRLHQQELDYSLIGLKHVKHFATGQDIPNCVCFKSPIAPQRESGDGFDRDIQNLKDRKASGYLAESKFKGMEFFKQRFIRSDMTPPPKYFETCIAGAKKLDALFGTKGMFETFKKTTYLYYIDRNIREKNPKKAYTYYGLYSVEDFLERAGERFQLKGSR